MYRPFIPQRVVEGTCVLDGPKFKSKVCRRCGYRRNRSKAMPRYAMCDDPQTVEEKRHETLMPSATDGLSTVANGTRTE
jgi:hypothetical protein